MTSLGVPEDENVIVRDFVYLINGKPVENRGLFHGFQLGLHFLGG